MLLDNLVLEDLDTQTQQLEVIRQGLPVRAVAAVLGVVREEGRSDDRVSHVR